MSKFGNKYAERNFGLSSDERTDNESAVHAIVSSLGGLEGTIVSGLGFTQLSHIMEADPNDDLSGLRLLASRMDYSSGWSTEDNWRQEQPLDPTSVRQWLVGTGRVIESTDGTLTPLDTDHLTLSGLAIINSDIPVKLSEAYEGITDNPMPFKEKVLAEMSWNIIELYKTEE